MGCAAWPVATTRANVDQILEALKQSGAQVLLAGMTLPPNYGPEYIAAFPERLPGSGGEG